jgi:hypothetical protein
MKQKRQTNRAIVQFDLLPQSPSKKSFIKIKSKVVSMMTTCEVCEKHITKKNQFNGFHLCDNCNTLTPPEIYLKLTSSLEEEVPSYVDWDADLDYLYENFWLSE